MRELKTIEMHTCGEPARIVIDGMPELRGSTMQEKEQDMREHYDNLRTAIIQEPRGHQNMFGIVLTKPCRPEADFGVLFLNGVGYEGMCGHGTICLATAAVNEGWIPLTEPETAMKIDTVTGLVPVRIRVTDARRTSRCRTSPRSSTAPIRRFTPITTAPSAPTSCSAGTCSRSSTSTSRASP